MTRRMMCPVLPLNMCHGNGHRNPNCTPFHKRATPHPSPWPASAMFPLSQFPPLAHDGSPLYLQRVSMFEEERMPGSGPVDVPNHYYGFRVGPILLGCFILPEVRASKARGADEGSGGRGVRTLCGL